ncbi:MAG: hypothetical protein BGO37_12230 [Cellulomonas sp. 73-92]|uniref:DUF3040 domain-containing protein n=1 Tax=Cellulomonas sp. 73-92 TaxID=1895740 RepID=UPI000925A5E5|nr:DUF3040 domain-containing protein [Cellulomonas sp. 73-92]OJV79706.1 MAG: hypothetical protein BGO37_12230 [Cellulomonas sp. 73-92]
MPLSEYEQRVLEQMERQLASDDPRLANTLTQRGRRPVLRYVLSGVGAAAGLLLLVLGAATAKPALGVVGFVLMFAAVAYVFAAPRRHKTPAEAGAAQPAQPAAAPHGRSAGRRRGFMTRLEERWDRRRGESGR